jgi:hypothetical protein
VGALSQIWAAINKQTNFILQGGLYMTLFAEKSAICGANVIAEPFPIFYPSRQAGIMRLCKSQIS